MWLPVSLSFLHITHQFGFRPMDFILTWILSFVNRPSLIIVQKKTLHFLGMFVFQRFMKACSFLFWGRVDWCVFKAIFTDRTEKLWLLFSFHNGSLPFWFKKLGRHDLISLHCFCSLSFSCFLGFKSQSFVLSFYISLMDSSFDL